MATAQAAGRILTGTGGERKREEGNGKRRSAAAAVWMPGSAAARAGPLASLGGERRGLRGAAPGSLPAPRRCFSARRKRG